MDRAPQRLGAAAEWLVAAVFLLATVLVGVLIVGEMRAVRAPAPSTEPAPPPSARPADLLTSGISVPSLLLLDGKQVRIGETLEQVTAQLGAASRTGADVVEPARLGDRITRSYEHAGTKFVLVFEPFERNGPPRVSAIYLR